MTTNARMWLISAGTRGTALTQRAATTVHVSLDTHQQDQTSSSQMMALNALVISELQSFYFVQKFVFMILVHKHIEMAWDSTQRYCQSNPSVPLPGCCMRLFSLSLIEINTLEMIFPSAFHYIPALVTHYKSFCSRRTAALFPLLHNKAICFCAVKQLIRCPIKFRGTLCKMQCRGGGDFSSGVLFV